VKARKFTKIAPAPAPDELTGYYQKPAAPGLPALITDFLGAPLGTAEIVSSWLAPSFISHYIHQVEAQIGGYRYTGRSRGNGMLWKGKRMAQQYHLN